MYESTVPAALAVLHAERGHSPGVRVGPLLMISGMLGRDAELAVVPDPRRR